jgi:branched-chain amino acid transport system permease protein
MSAPATGRFRLTTQQVLAIGGGLLVLCWLVVLFTHSDQLQPTIFGVGEGAIIAAVALSVTLTFRGSGVVNFAAAAVSMYSSFIFYDLRNNGTLFLPPPIPNIQVVSVGYSNNAFIGRQPIPPIPVWAAFALTLVECVLLGLIFHFFIFRPLRKAPPLAKVVASIGLFILLLSAVSLMFPSSSGYNFAPILPSGSWHIGSIAILQAQVILVVIVVAVAATFWAVFKYTRFGLATRAAAENERGALILGYNPNRLAAVNWVASTVLAGAFGVLFASLNGTINPVTVTLLIVPALAASLMGRFTSFPITVIAALLIGSSQAWIQAISSDSWVPGFLKSGGQGLQGIPDVLPFLVIVLVLFFQGEKLPSRGSIATMRMPRAPRPTKVALRGAILFVAVALSAFLLNSDWRFALQLSIVASIICGSLVVLTGFVGQISLMQMTIAGIAGFVLSKFCEAHGIPFPFGPIIAAGVATLVGLVAAVPALRIRGVNLAVVTLAAAVVIENFVYDLPMFQVNFQSNANVSPPSLFGFRFGPGSPWTKIFGHPSGAEPNPWFSIFCLIVAFGVLASIIWIRRSRLGRRMLAVRSNERAASAAGVNVAATKLTAFAIAAFIAGIGGVLWAYMNETVDTTVFSSLSSIIFLAVAYLAGIAMIEGPPIGGIIFQGALFATFLSVVIHINPEYAVLIAGFGLIFASINNPEGIAGSLGHAMARLRAKRAGTLQPLEAAPASPDPTVAAAP